MSSAISSHQRKIVRLLLAITILSSVAVCAKAQGNLLITPRRVVFEGSKRSADLNLANTGQDSATYAISVVQIRMREDGGFDPIETPDPGQRFADKNIRYFPRMVTLGPKEAQVVKVQLIKTEELTPGEYRSHFYFRSIPRLKPLGNENSGQDSAAISIKLTPIFGITIPVIIRVGEYNAGISITDPSFSFVQDTIPVIRMNLNRTGTMSVYGDIVVDHIASDGHTTRVGTANGVAVYSPNTVRKFAFSLNRVAGIDFSKGKLKITYNVSSDIKRPLNSETEFILNK